MSSQSAGEAARLQPCEHFFWRSQPLDQKTGSDIFAALFEPQTLNLEVDAIPSRDCAIATLLESPYPLPPDCLPAQATDMARYSICAGAPRVVEGISQVWTPPLGQVLPLLEKMGQCAPPIAMAEGTAVDLDLPFMGGWLGWLGYDCAWEIERLPWLKEDTLPFPIAFWYEPAEFAVLDHHLQQLWLAADTPDGLAQMADRLSRRLSASMPNTTDSTKTRLTSDFSSIYIEEKFKSAENFIGEPLKAVAHQNQPSTAVRHQPHTYDLKFETAQAEFEQAVIQAKAHIKAGDVFQVNHSLRFHATTTLPSWEVYKRLHRINPSPFASYWHTPWGAVVSCSPERLVQLKSGIVQSRPIAGTQPRGQTQVDDSAIAQRLAGDRKECAEHIMLVDLERNDLGRVCKWGTVQVAELMTIERYSHVMHLVSNVVGELASERTIAQLIAAMFPGGTITGCPKVRCMEIIETLEPVRRSLFYGSCGYLDRRGRLDLNILIRTLLIAPIDQQPVWAQVNQAQTVWGQVGAGIVADSEPEREWRESLQKAQAQLLALGL